MIDGFDAPRDGLRPDRGTIEALRSSPQASLAIANYFRFAELREKWTLNSGLQRQQRLISLTQNDLPILLRKDLDQTIAIQNLNQRSQRVRAGLAITESVSRQLDASSALQALARDAHPTGDVGGHGGRIDQCEGRASSMCWEICRATSPEALFDSGIRCGLVAERRSHSDLEPG